MSNFINQSRYIVIVAGKPEFKCEFPHAKAAEAEAYKAKLLAEKGNRPVCAAWPAECGVRMMG